MRQNIYIRQFFATSLLLIFALSITPTRALHYIFANHKDAAVKQMSEQNKPSISIAGYNCQCNNLVVVSPFAYQQTEVSFEIPEVYSLRETVFLRGLHIIYHFSFGLRGPPSIA